MKTTKSNKKATTKKSTKKAVVKAPFLVVTPPAVMPVKKDIKVSPVVDSTGVVTMVPVDDDAK
jgi:hypothetical protein